MNEILCCNNLDVDRSLTSCRVNRPMPKNANRNLIRLCRPMGRFQKSNIISEIIPGVDKNFDSTTFRQTLYKKL